MPTVYIQPGSGTGNGTSATPYYYDQLSTAETAAGSGGTILFTDGSYDSSGDITLSSTLGITYQSVNKLGATLNNTDTSSTNLKFISTNCTDSQGPILKDLKFYNYYIAHYGVTLALADSFKVEGCHMKMESKSLQAVGLIYNASNKIQRIYNNIFEAITPSAGSNVVYSNSGTDFKGNTVFLNASSGTFGIGLAMSSAKNNIFYCNDAARIGAYNIATNGSDNLFYQWGSGQSGGTGNLIGFDPLFVDSANGDFRLRPSSPAIGSNTNGHTAGISRILFKYPDAVWFDSHYSGGGSDGSVDAPYTDFVDAQTAAGGTKFIAVKNGTHSPMNAGQGRIKQASGDLLLVGESTDAILSCSWRYAGAAIEFTSADGTLRLETIKIYHDGTSAVYELITTSSGDTTFIATGSIIEMGPNTLALTSNRGFLTVPKNAGSTKIVTLTGCTLIGGTNYASGAPAANSWKASSTGAILGGSSVDGWTHLTIKSCTFRILKNNWNVLMGQTNKANVQKFVFEDNIIYGFNDYLAIACGTDGDPAFPYSAVPNLSVKRNCYYKTYYSLVNSPPDTSGAVTEDPRFVDVANYNFNLRPSSPCVASPTTPPSDAVYVFNGTGSGGSGTYSNPYHLPEIATAELDAGVGGTIIFKNGTYIPNDQVYLQGDPFYTRLTYKAESPGGVIFDFTSTIYGLTVGKNTGPGFTGTTLIKGITFKNPKGGGAGGQDGYAGINTLVDGTVYSFDNMIHFEECNLIFTDIGVYTASSLIGSFDTSTKCCNFTLTRCTMFIDGPIKTKTGAWLETPLIGRPQNKQAIILDYCTVVGGPNLEWGKYASATPRPYLLEITNNLQSKLSITNSIFYINPLSPIFLNATYPIGFNINWSWTATPSQTTFTCENNVGYNLRDDSPGGAVPLPADAALKLSVDDPQLIDPSNNNLELRPISPCIGKGV